MLRIPRLENSDILLMAGERLDQVGVDFCHVKSDLRMNSLTAIRKDRTACPAQDCNCCTSHCPYADFIRYYGNHQECD